MILARFSSNHENPFHSIPKAAAVIAALCLIFRAVSVFIGKPNFNMAYIGSHARMDALFSGVLIGYFYHFRPALLEKLMGSTRNRLAIAVGSLGLLSFGYFYHRESIVLATAGYSFIYLGFTGVLLLSLYVRGVFSGKLARITELVGSWIAYVGMYSYSIYLWHGPTASWLPGFFRRTLGFPVGEYGRFAVYFIGSLVIGIAMSKLVEYPILHLRDRISPASDIVPVAAQVGIGPTRTPPVDSVISTT